jgi:signal peptidase I
MRTLQSLSGTLVIAIFVITFVVQAFQIPSESMEDTLLVGDYLLVDKMTFGPSSALAPLPYEKINRGDVVVFRYPVDPNQHFVKRVIGLPGDRIHMRAGRVYVNGETQFEPYVVEKAYGDSFYRDNFPTTRELPLTVSSEWWNDFPSLVRNGDLLIPEGHYFVMGDNRHNSSDSRFWGLVPRESIVGRPLLIYFSIVPPPPAATPAAASDRIERFTARVWHLPEVIRWHRAFHFVR